VSGAFLFAPITEAQAAGYFILHNRGEAADTIVEVSADWADHGMIHETREEGGRVRMSHVAALAVPARDSVVLQPGGLHVMLMRLSRMPEPGDTVAWLLRMSSGAEVRVVAPVVAYGQEP
jgi:copper(I)-binding protein